MADESATGTGPLAKTAKVSAGGSVTDGMLKVLFPEKRRALIPYALLITGSLITSHLLTYWLIFTGRGYETNPIAALTIWMPPGLNLGVWFGGVMAIFSLEWQHFEKHKKIFGTFTMAWTLICLFDAVNDLAVCTQVRLL